MRILGLKWMDAAVLCLYAAVVFVTIAHHEPWGDEAQSWLLGRDLSLPDLIFRALRYEGSPGLWHAINWLVARIGLPYAAINYVAGAIATGGMYVLLRFSPFPAALRYLFPFTYFFCFQFAVIARSYVLAPVLCFGIAHLIRTRSQRYVTIAVLGGLLANTSVHGALLAGSLLAGYAWASRADVAQAWSRRQMGPILAATLVFAAFGVLAVMSARPAPDVNFLAKPAVNATHIPALQVLLNRVSRAMPLLALPITRNTVVGVACILGLAWFLYRNQSLVFFLPIPVLLIFFSAVYVSAWHTGLLLVAAITALWIAWPTELPMFSTAICVVLAVAQIPWTVSAVRFDLGGDYDGSRKMAQYVAGLGPGKRIFGYGFYMVAVNAYFPRNIFANTPASYWFWSSLNRTDKETDRIAAEHPDYLVFAGVAPSNGLDPELEALRRSAKLAGYSVERRFLGSLLFRDEVLETNQYEIWSNAMARAGIANVY